MNARMTFAARSGPIRWREASADSSIGEELPVASLVAAFPVHASVAICQEAVGRCSVDAVERAKKKVPANFDKWIHINIGSLIYRSIS